MTDTIAALPPVNASVTIQPVAVSLAGIQVNAGGNSPLDNLPPGTTLQGFVINRDVNNNPIIRTDNGDVQVTSEVFLKTGSQVVLTVDTSQPNLARILSVDGLSPQAYSAQVPRGITQDTISPSALQGAMPTTATIPGTSPAAAAPVLQALILEPVVPGNTAAPAALNNTLNLLQQGPVTAQLATLAQLKTGTPLKLTVLDIRLPPVASQTAGAIQQATPAVVSPSAGGIIPQPPATVTPQPLSAKADGQASAQPKTPSAETAEAVRPAATTPLSPAILRQSAPSAPPQNAPPLQANATAQTTALRQPAFNQASSFIPASASAAPAAPAATVPSQQGVPAAVGGSPVVPNSLTGTPAPASPMTPATALPLTSANTQQPMAAHATSEEAIPTVLSILQEATPHAEPVKSPLLIQQAYAPAPAAAVTQTPTAASTAPAASNIQTQPTAPLEARVIGQEADGATVLHTDFATLKVYSPQPLPTGTTLLVTAEIDTTARPAPLIPLPPVDQFANATARGLDTLDELITALKSTHPELAREVQQRLPNMGAGMTSGLIAFIVAIKEGDMNALFGKRTARQLEWSAPELMGRLRGEIAQMSQSYRDSPLQHWAAITLPMMFGQELVQAQLYIGREPEQTASAQARTGRGHRFVLEVGMGQIGPMQFDGFVKSAQRAKSFDLVVRSATPLEPVISQGIRDIFLNSVETTGITGQLQFQAGDHHFVKPLADKQQAGHGNANTILA